MAKLNARKYFKYWDKFAPLLSQFTLDNQSQESITKLYDLMNVLEKEDNRESKSVLAAVYSTLAFHKKAYDLSVTLYDEEYKAQWDKKLVELKKKAESQGDNFAIKSGSEPVSNEKQNISVNNFIEIATAEKQQKSKEEMVEAGKKYWENYHPLRQEWIKLIEKAKKVALEKHGTDKLSVYIATEENRLVFYAIIPGEKKGKFLYRCNGGSLMKEQIDLLKIFCVDYLEVQTNWREDLGCTGARISTDFDVTI